MRSAFVCCALLCLNAMTACGGSKGDDGSGNQDVVGAIDVPAVQDGISAADSRAQGETTVQLDASMATDAVRSRVDQGGADSPAGSFQVGAVPESEPEFALYFDKHASVFGLHVFGTAAVPDEDMLHAAAVLAQYLDNDEDGEADDPEILSALQEAEGGPASMVMFATEWEIESSGIFDSNLGDRAVQDLYATETHPEGSSLSKGFDATLEEVLHLVTHHGWAKAYPADFAEHPGSTLTEAMDVARGGQFTSIPASYPEEAWYHYDDETCSYGCMATEYLYWALTSLLGGQSYPGRCEEIEHEWELCTPEAVQTTDTAITELLQGSGYTLPTVLPDGSYEPAL